MAEQIDNKRDYFRASTNLSAVVRSKGKKHDVNIIDISAGGLKFESDVAFFAGETFTIDFSLLDTEFSKPCRIVHVSQKDPPINTYGCSFEYVKDADLKKLNSFVFAAQAAPSPGAAEQ